MTEKELTVAAALLQQYDETVRKAGHTENVQAATSELVIIAEQLLNEVRRLKLVVHQQELTGLGAVVLVAEIERLKADIERSRQVFRWESNDPWSWGLYSTDGCFDTVEIRKAERGTLWSNTFYRGYFDTLDEARAWVETRLRDSGVIRPIDVVEVRQ